MTGRPVASDATLRSVCRFLAAHMPDASPHAQPLPPHEFVNTVGERPRTVGARILEGTTLQPRRIRQPPVAGIGAFLDGIQQGYTVCYRYGTPVILGKAAAAIRVRRNRRLTTWRPRVEHRLYLPFSWIDPAPFAALGLPLVDLSTGADGEPVSRHPTDIAEQAFHRLQGDRERLEFALAEAWCTLEDAPLLIDGGISGSDRVASSATSIGLVKSHRTLYAEGDALSTVLALGAGERSSVFRIASKRTAVASWYLRLRDPTGRDPLWGLVRVEIAEQGASLGDRADLVSRWILAEASPLALPDTRWDKMVYGVRDCEEFLRAIS